MMSPRLLKSMPTASNSRLYQPDAMPKISRPPDIWSMLEICLASTTGLRSGSTRIPVPSLIVVVRAATAVSSDRASMIGNGGSTPSRIWSQTHSDSYPKASMRTP